MAIGLPSMAYGDGISKRKQVKFGGYNHTLAAENGDLWDMENLTSDFYPLLSPRTRRWTCRTLTKPNGLYAHDGLYWADGTDFYADGELKGIVTDGHKKFASLGAYIVILPDKKYYNRLTGDFGALESSWSGSAKIQDGTYAGEEAKANTIYAVGAGAKFNEGDAVTISGGLKITAGRISQMDAGTTSGNVALKLAEGCDVCTIRTISGGVALTLPENADLTLSFGTVSGVLDSEIALLSREGVLIAGDGAQQYDIHTTSGGLTLRTEEEITEEK